MTIEQRCDFDHLAVGVPGAPRNDGVPIPVGVEVIIERKLRVSGIDEFLKQSGNIHRKPIGTRRKGDFQTAASRYDVRS